MARFKRRKSIAGSAKTTLGSSPPTSAASRNNKGKKRKITPVDTIDLTCVEEASAPAVCSNKNESNLASSASALQAKHVCVDLIDLVDDEAPIDESGSAFTFTSQDVVAHIMSVVREESWGRGKMPCDDPFALPRYRNATSFYSWFEIKAILPGNLLKELALRAYESFECNIVAEEKACHYTMGGFSCASERIVDFCKNTRQVISVEKEYHAAAATKRRRFKVKVNNTKSSGTGYGGTTNDVQKVFAAQGAALDQESKIDAKLQVIVHAMGTSLKKCDEEQLHHPLIYGALLNAVKVYTRLLSNSFHDMCTRSYLFKAVFTALDFIISSAEKKSSPYIHLFVIVHPDEVVFKTETEIAATSDESSPPPHSIADHCKSLKQQLDIVMSATSTTPPERRLMLVALKTVQNILGLEQRRLPSEKECSIDLTCRSGIHVNSYISVMSQMRLKMVSSLCTSAAYVFKNEAGKIKTCPAKRSTRILKELSTLSASLPIENSSSIFLVADDVRNDCLKALIIGPSETPYENGLFEFDILLPRDYPNKPPKMQLKTTGGGRVRFNPNLYANGKVCLSLLGTWAGPSWTCQCTLLQVLVSIQSLILGVDEPLFNEPGYEKSKGTASMSHTSAEYNKSLRESTIRYALLPYLNPASLQLSPFRHVIEEYFQRRHTAIRSQAAKWVRELEVQESSSSGSRPAFRTNIFRSGTSTLNSLLSATNKLNRALDAFLLMKRVDRGSSSSKPSALAIR